MESITPFMSQGFVQAVSLLGFAFIISLFAFRGRLQYTVAYWLYFLAMSAQSLGLILEPFPFAFRTVLMFHAFEALFAAIVIRLLFRVMLPKTDS